MPRRKSRFKFTEAYIKGCEETVYSGAETVWDTQTPGFGVRFGPGGGSYQVKYRVGTGRAGKQRLFTIGKTPHISLKDARNRASEIITDGRRGIDAADKRDEDRAAVTVKRAAQEFIKKHVEVKLKPSTQKEYTRIINNEIIPQLGSKKIRDITVVDVAKLHFDKSTGGSARPEHKKKTEERGIDMPALKGSPGSANRIRATFSKLLKWSESEGYRDPGTNPAQAVTPNPEFEAEDFRYLEPSQVERLFSRLASAEMDPRRRVDTKNVPNAIRFLVFTGLRRNEVLNLRWTDVAKDFLSVTIPKKVGKKARTVLLTDQAIDLLRSLTRSENPFVFPGRDLPINDPDAAAGRCRPIKISGFVSFWRRLELPHRLHDLRHTYASIMLSYAGATLSEVGEQLGHKSPKTTMRYAKLMKDGRKKAVGKASSGFAEALG
jgi:integrase